MTDVTNPDATDTSELDDIFEDDVQEEGAEDVKGKSEVENLTLEELNKVSGRKFESKADYLKHYAGLKSLVGNQELAKERKKKEVKEDTSDAVSRELADLKKDLAKKDFLLETPTAKEYLDIVEAYAEKNNLSLSEAWESKFTQLAESSQSKNVINKNRINPVQSQRTSELAKLARTGNQKAQDDLINELVWRK